MSTLTVLVLLFSYHTSRSSTAIVAAETRPVTTSSKTSDSTGSGSGSSAASSADSAGQDPTSASATSGSSSGSGSSGSSSSSSARTSTAAKTYAGDAIMTRYGNVQVQITVKSGKITAVDVLQVPMEDRHDEMINSMAVPVYNQEAVSAQSAQIDVVSGATYTWQGYTQSLQSAIDAAHL
ncbi:FMN-binding protein [Terrabacter sp. NPDC080008]|uniref:FMN-binding protein n=1 Tax=Terrabacter sp. NPDC080008 TaxID=3155176 RepID=UPI003450C0E8